MSEYILNLLPLKEEEKEEFKSIAPDATHVFYPQTVYVRHCDVSTEEMEKATVILGWPDPQRMKFCKNLKWFQTMFTGTEEYEHSGILPEGVRFTSSKGSNARSVAEHALTVMMVLCRKIPRYCTAQKEHRWEAKRDLKSVYGGTILILGTGNIGKIFASLCRGLGARIVGVKRTVTGTVEGFDEVYPVGKLDNLLPQADVIVNMLPHSEETIGLIDERRIALLKKDAIFINVGRQSAVDYDALMEAVKAEKLWGVGLDVFNEEPLSPDSPLWDVPNVFIDPHIAGGVMLEISRRGVTQMALDNLKHYIMGEPLFNQVR